MPSRADSSKAAAKASWRHGLFAVFSGDFEGKSMGLFVGFFLAKIWDQGKNESIQDMDGYGISQTQHGDS